MPKRLSDSQLDAALTSIFHAKDGSGLVGVAALWK